MFLNRKISIYELKTESDVSEVASFAFEGAIHSEAEVSDVALTTFEGTMITHCPCKCK